jgi:hypothetical protein
LRESNSVKKPNLYIYFNSVAIKGGEEEITPTKRAYNTPRSQKSSREEGRS